MLFSIITGGGGCVCMCVCGGGGVSNYDHDVVPVKEARRSSFSFLLDVDARLRIRVTRADANQQHNKTTCAPQVLGFLGQIGVWSLRRESLADKSKDHTRDCDFQQDPDYKSVTTLTASFSEQARQLRRCFVLGPFPTDFSAPCCPTRAMYYALLRVHAEWCL